MVDWSPKVQGIVSNVLVNTLILLFQCFFFPPLKYAAALPGLVETLRHKEGWARDLEEGPGNLLRVNQLIVTM